MKLDKKMTTLIIFGATGDLARRKIIPAIYDLHCRKLIPNDFKVVAFSRKDLSHENYREFAQSSLLEKDLCKNQDNKVNNFLKNFFYVQGDFADLKSYHNLGIFLNNLDQEQKICSEKLFYLAVPPNLYEMVFDNLSQTNLIVPCVNTNVLTKILVEKPFGNNAEEAKRLDKKLGSLFDEKQIFRIDHYLAKEAVQNILSFRFANSIFEPVWNSEHIEYIEIKLHEKNNVENRSNFFDAVGSLKDVGQNHLLQILSLITMEDPMVLTPEKIREARAKILGQIIPYKKSVFDYAIRAQYEGYLEHDGIKNKSQTETFFRVALQIKNTKFNNMPIYLESGKAMPTDLAEIKIVFKDKKSSVCHPDKICHYNNEIKIQIQPEEKISISFWTKKPGIEMNLVKKELSFFTEMNDDSISAYEKVLFDCIVGDQTLFPNTTEIMEQWGIIQKITDEWQKIPLLKYKQGTLPDLKNNNEN